MKIRLILMLAATFMALLAPIGSVIGEPVVPPAVVDALRVQQCKAKIGKAVESEYCAVLVTNDANTQLVTYLEGKLFAGSGQMMELISSRNECLQHYTTGLGGCMLNQPFSVRQRENASLVVTREGIVSITWPGGGGTTTHSPTCSANGTYLFDYGSYTTVLTLKPCAGQPTH